MCDQLECMLFLSYVIMKNDSICLNRFQDWTKSIFWPRFVVLNMTQKNKCYAIMLSLKMVHTLILGRGNVGNSFPVLCRFYSVLAHARSSWVILKLIFFKFQGPLPHTANHFWQMIWEQNTAAIIMLNKVVEKNQASTNLIIDFYI